MRPVPCRKGIMQTCDICDRKTDSLTELKKEYQTHDIKEVCPECLAVLNDFVGKVTSVLLEMFRKEKQGWVRRFIDRLKKGDL